MSESTRPKTWGVAAFLTAIAGFVDAVGFLSFARIYTANMSGNSVALGIALSGGNWPMVLFRFWPILLYLVGLLLGRSMIEIGATRRVQHIASVAFTFEVVLLGIAGLLGAHSISDYAAIALLALAMGIQNSALTQFSSLTLHSGFVTGTLLKFSEQLVAGRHGGQPLRLALILLCIWFCYVAGAVAGAWGRSVWETRALVGPIFALIILIAIDVRQPLAIQEERKQIEME